MTIHDMVGGNGAIAGLWVANVTNSRHVDGDGGGGGGGHHHQQQKMREEHFVRRRPLDQHALAKRGQEAGVLAAGSSLGSLGSPGSVGSVGLW